MRKVLHILAFMVAATLALAAQDNVCTLQLKQADVAEKATGTIKTGAAASFSVTCPGNRNVPLKVQLTGPFTLSQSSGQSAELTMTSGRAQFGVLYNPGNATTGSMTFSWDDGESAVFDHWANPMSLTGVE